MNDDYIMVDFLWCESCKHQVLSEEKDPCNECLTHPVNYCSEKPVKYEGRENK